MTNTFKESEMETQLQHLDWSRKQINISVDITWLFGAQNWDAESGLF